MGRARVVPKRARIEMIFVNCMLSSGVLGCVVEEELKELEDVFRRMVRELRVLNCLDS